MKSTYLLSLLVLISNSVLSQIYEDDNPVNPYYQKIQFANFPQPEKNKVGEVLYISDTGYINKFVLNLSNHLILSQKRKLYLYKFKHDKYRYNNYQLVFDSYNYKSDKKFQTLYVTCKVSIYADKNIRKFNARRARFLLERESTAEVYIANVSFALSFDPQETEGLHHLKYDSLSLHVLKGGGEYLSYIKSKFNDWSYLETHLEYNFRDEIVDKYHLPIHFLTKDLYIKPIYDMTNLMFYRPIFIK